MRKEDVAKIDNILAREAITATYFSSPSDCYDNGRPLSYELATSCSEDFNEDDLYG